MMRAIDDITLVKEKNDVPKNIKYLSQVLKTNDRLCGRIKYAHAWYAYEVSNGDWAFGFSKFIGFQDLKADEYLKYYNKGLHGWDTENRLGEWFIELPPKSTKFDEMHLKLSNFLAKYNKEPRAKVRIYIVDSQRDKANPEIITNPSDKIVNLMVEVANTLPSKNLRDLRKRLSA